jgi:hypothetical protein
MMESFERFRKLAHVANDLMMRFSIQDIYIIMRRIDRIYPPQCYFDIQDIDDLEVKYDCYSRC